MYTFKFICDTNVFMKFTKDLQILFQSKYNVIVYIPDVIINELDKLKETHVGARQANKLIFDLVNSEKICIEASGYIDHIDIEPNTNNHAMAEKSCKSSENNDDKICRFVADHPEFIVLTQDRSLHNKVSLRRLNSIYISDEFDIDDIIENYLDLEGFTSEEKWAIFTDVNSSSIKNIETNDYCPNPHLINNTLSVVNSPINNLVIPGSSINGPGIENEQPNNLAYEPHINAHSLMNTQMGNFDGYQPINFISDVQNTQNYAGANYQYLNNLSNIINTRTGSYEISQHINSAPDLRNTQTENWKPYQHTNSTPSIINAQIKNSETFYHTNSAPSFINTQTGDWGSYNLPNNSPDVENISTDNVKSFNFNYKHTSIVKNIRPRHSSLKKNNTVQTWPHSNYINDNKEYIEIRSVNNESKSTHQFKKKKLEDHVNELIMKTLAVNKLLLEKYEKAKFKSLNNMIAFVLKNDNLFKPILGKFFKTELTKLKKNLDKKKDEDEDEDEETLRKLFTVFKLKP